MFIIVNLTITILLLFSFAFPFDGAAATLSGTVVLKGTPPKRKRLDMGLDPNCVSLTPKGAWSEDVLTGENGGLANAFIFVKEGLPKRDYPIPQPLVLLDRECQFSPHVFGLLVGQTLEVRNLDPTFHNVHVKSKANAEYNVGMPVQNSRVTHKFAKQEIGVKVVGDLHPWEFAYVHILEHPYFAVSNPRGSFAIRDLPAGTYTIAAWHEVYGTSEQKAQISADTEVLFRFTTGDHRAKVR